MLPENLKKHLIYRCRRRFLFVALALLPFLSRAQGDLMIYPKRIVFDGSQRSQDLSLANNGNDTARYVISVVQIRMKEDGSFETIDQPDPGQNFADKNFRFFPRTVTLPPHQAQKVKVQLIQFSQLPAGEYRSHLYFRAEAEKKPLEKENPPADSSSLSIRIVPVYGISIPVLIRSGEPTTEIALSRVAFGWEKDSLPLLQVHLNRSGNMSVYGDVTVDHISSSGLETRVAQVKGVAVYTPNRSRILRLPLERKAGVDYKKGALHVVFTDLSGKKEKVAQEQIFLE